MSRLLLLAGALALPPALPLGAAMLGAQDARQVSVLPQWEARLDATASRAPAAHAGLGLNVRAGYYARLGVALAAGATFGEDDIWRGSQRVDAVVRFVLDPFMEQPRGLYGGAGVTATAVHDQMTPALLLVAGIEGRPRRGRTLALEVALGGGVRLGLVVRRARPGRAR